MLRLNLIAFDVVDLFSIFNDEGLHHLLGPSLDVPAMVMGSLVTVQIVFYVPRHGRGESHSCLSPSPTACIR